MMSTTKHTHVGLPDYLVRKLKLVATAEGVSISDLVADLIAEPLKERVHRAIDQSGLHPPQEDDPTES